MALLLSKVAPTKLRITSPDPGRAHAQGIKRARINYSGRRRQLFRVEEAGCTSITEPYQTDAVGEPCAVRVRVTSAAPPRPARPSSRGSKAFVPTVRPPPSRRRSPRRNAGSGRAAGTPRLPPPPVAGLRRPHVSLRPRMATGATAARGGGGRGGAPRRTVSPFHTRTQLGR
jgi:hypothetical protein